MALYELTESNGQRLKKIIKVFRHYKVIDTLLFSRNPENLRLAFEALGPTFIKIGQILSVQADIFDATFTDELKKLQDNTPKESYSIIKETIENSLGLPIEELFQSFSEEALASASMAQVHRAQLETGEDVVVKVRHKNIKTLILQDLELMGKAIKILNILPVKQVTNPEGILKELKTSIEKELDFTQEAENILRFSENNKQDKNLYCLQCYLDYSSEEVLVMDFIPGNKITVLMDAPNKENIKADVANNIINNYMQQVFEAGFFHADPHPGNIFILKDYRIAYLDFGMMGFLDKDLLQTFNQFLYGLYFKDLDILTDTILALCSYADDLDENKLYFDVEKLFTAYINKPIESIDLGQAFQQVFTICRKHQLMLPSSITLLLKSIVTIEGILHDLNPEITITRAVRPYMKSHIIKHFEWKKAVESYGTSLYELFRDAPKLPTQLIKFLNSLKKGRMRIHLEHHNLGEFAEAMNQIANKLVLALIISSLIIGSSLLIQSDALRYVGIIGFLLAGIMGFIIVFTILLGKKRKK